MRRIVLGSVALSLVCVVACGTDDAGFKRAYSTTSTTRPVPVSVATTESTPVASDAGASRPSVPAANPEAYAPALIDAWVHSDRSTAARLATAEAVNTLFSYEAGAEEGGTPPTWALQGCEGAAGSSYCTFNAGGDPTVIVRVGNEAAANSEPQAITEVRVEG